jgi:hypothetical protein
LAGTHLTNATVPGAGTTTFILSNVPSDRIFADDFE